jgi:hypothetical protein
MNCIQNDTGHNTRIGNICASYVGISQHDVIGFSPVCSILGFFQYSHIRHTWFFFNMVIYTWIHTFVDFISYFLFQKKKTNTVFENAYRFSF